MAKQRSLSALSETSGDLLMFCRECGTDLSEADLADLGLRLPEPGEPAEEYCDSVMIDPAELRHLGCLAPDTSA
ncbi:MAG: hypothetical protein IH958_05610 [Chloroflexi bacterium]|nr:hypothetical protein [Chloroflexota bacterium]